MLVLAARLGKTHDCISRRVVLEHGVSSSIHFTHNFYKQSGARMTDRLEVLLGEKPQVMGRNIYAITGFCGCTDAKYVKTYDIDSDSERLRKHVLNRRVAGAGGFGIRIRAISYSKNSDKRLWKYWRTITAF